MRTRPATKDELRTSSPISSARSTSRASCATRRCGRPWCTICARCLQRAAMTEQEVRTFHGVIKFLAKDKHSEE